MGHQDEWWGYFCDNADLVMIFRMLCFNIPEMVLIFTAFDQKPEYQKTITTLREIAEEVASNTHASQRYKSVLSNQSDTWDGQASMNTYSDIVGQHAASQQRLVTQLGMWGRAGRHNARRGVRAHTPRRGAVAASPACARTVPAHPHTRWRQAQLVPAI